MVTNYWDNVVPIWDKQALVVVSSTYWDRWGDVTNPASTSEGNIKDAFRDFPQKIQNFLGASVPFPSDVHSAIAPCHAGGASNWGLVGTPDFVLHNHRGTYSVTAVVEIKTPWNVTPQQIDQVLDGTGSARS